MKFIDTRGAIRTANQLPSLPKSVFENCTDSFQASDCRHTISVITFLFTHLDCTSQFLSLAFIFFFLSFFLAIFSYPSLDGAHIYVQMNKMH